MINIGIWRFVGRVLEIYRGGGSTLCLGVLLVRVVKEFFIGKMI